MSIKDFNGTVIDMINDLASAIPTFTDLTIVSSLASGMYRVDPNNTTIIDTFYPLITEHEKLIENRQESAILEILQNLLPGQYSTTAAYVWEQLSEQNKGVMWDYISTLKDKAVKIKTVVREPKQVDITDDCELFTIYNNIWKEFFHILIKHDEGNAEKWTKCKERLHDYTKETKATFHKRVKGHLGMLLSSIKGTKDVMTLIMPKDGVYMKKEVEVDLARFETSAESSITEGLIDEVTVPQLLSTILRLKDIEELPLYWHYIKVMTTFLDNCPPELSAILVPMASTLQQFNTESSSP